MDNVPKSKAVENAELKWKAERRPYFLYCRRECGQSEIDSDYFPSYIRFVDSEKLSFAFVNAFLLLLFKLIIAFILKKFHTMSKSSQTLGRGVVLVSASNFSMVFHMHLFT